MPAIKPPTVSKEVSDEISRAEKMHNFILATMPDGFVSDTDVKIIVAALFSLTLEHHGAILYLLKAGQFDGSAFALVRPLVEASYRAHWVYACAKPDIVTRLKNGEEVEPGLINMATEVEKKVDGGGIFSSIAPHIKALHAYTHGGLMQTARRFGATGDVMPNYADGAKIEAIKATTAYTVMLAIAWCQLVSTDAPDKEPRSIAIVECYMKLYPIAPASARP